MQSILPTIINTNIENGQWLTVVIAVFIAIILRVKLKSIVDFFEWHRTKQEKYVKTMLEIKEVDAPTREALVEHLNYLIYRKIKGIATNNDTRKRLQSLVNMSNGELQDFQISRAWKYIKPEDDKFFVEITSVNRFNDGLQRGLGVLFLFMAGAAFFTAVTGRDPVEIRFTLLCLCLLLFIGSMYLAWQRIPMRIAKNIAPILVRLQKEVTDGKTLAVIGTEVEARDDKSPRH